jgi:hypothetical protein
MAQWPTRRKSMVQILARMSYILMYNSVVGGFLKTNVMIQFLHNLALF